MTNVTNEMIMQMLQGMQSEMIQRFDGLEKEVKELRVEVNEFKQLSTEEHDRVVEKLDTITRQTAFNAENVNYLAGEVGKHAMIINRTSKQ